jgi:glycosyltransferase involved in cell wall biosynthesis
LSLSHWPGSEAVEQLQRIGKGRTIKVICQSKALRNALVEGGVRAQHCTAIQPEIPAGYKAKPRSAARRILNLSDEAQLILADPEISPWSNHRQLTWAAAIIRQFNKNIRILVSGCGSQVERLRAFDDSVNPPSFNIYPGENFGPEVLYGAADFLVLTATEAISPLSLGRAGAVGLPVVGSNSPALREYLKREHNALLFGPGPHNAGDLTRRRIRPLATAIVQLLEDRDLAKKLGQQLAKDMRGVFSGEKLLSAHLDVYSEIMGK